MSETSGAGRPVAARLSFLDRFLAVWIQPVPAPVEAAAPEGAARV